MSNDMKECPFCAETIKGKAIVCRYCGRELPPVVEETQDEPIGTPLFEEPKTIVEESESIEEPKPANTSYPSKEKQEQRNQVLLIIGLLVLIGCTLLGLYVLVIQPRVNNVYATINAPSGSGRLPQSNNSSNTGNTVNLYYGGIEILCATSAQNYSDMIDTIINKDDYGLRELASEGKVFTVPSKTKVLVLDVDLTMAKVRILEGSYINQTAWVAREAVGK